MLRDRLIVGPVLILALLGLLWLDQWLGALPVPALALPGGRYLPLADLLGRAQLPPGIVMLLGLVVLVGGGCRELATMLRAKGVAVAMPLLWIGATVGLLLMYLAQGYGAVQPQMAWFGTWLIVVLVVTLRGQTLDRRPEGALLAAGGVLLALVYLGGGAGDQELRYRGLFCRQERGQTQARAVAEPG